MNNFIDLAIRQDSYRKTQRDFWKEGNKLFYLQLRDREKYDELTNSDEFKEKNRLDHIEALKKYISIREAELEIAKAELDNVINRRPVVKSIISRVY